MSNNLNSLLANADLDLDLDDASDKPKAKRGVPDTDEIVVGRLTDESAARLGIFAFGLRAMQHSQSGTKPSRSESKVLAAAKGGDRKATLATLTLVICEGAGQTARANDRPRGRGAVASASTDEDANALVIIGA